MQISTYSDCELLGAIQRSDEGAFSELFRRYWRKVYAIAYARIRSEETTKEIVQELFISLWNKRNTLSINHLESYLYTAVKNRVLNHLQSQIVWRRHWEYYKKFIPKSENTTEEDVALNELMEALESEMDHLPEKSRKIFRLNRLEGRSVTEIANTLKLSEKAIQYHITKSIKTIRLHLKDYILTISFIVIIFS